MSLSSTELCSSALIRLGAEGIISFDDGSAEARVASRLYPLVRDALLSTHPWSFATRIVNAKSGCFMPDTVLKSLGKHDDVNGRKWLVTGEVLCIGRVPEADFPAYFATAVVARLAAEFCLPLTENPSRAERLSRLADAELKVARLVDSQQVRDA